jgi:hypothetical protein
MRSMPATPLSRLRGIPRANCRSGRSTDTGDDDARGLHSVGKRKSLANPVRKQYNARSNHERSCRRRRRIHRQSLCSPTVGRGTPARGARQFRLRSSRCPGPGIRGLTRAISATRRSSAGCCTEEKIDLVMHFAAFCYVGESVTDPLKYYFNNVAATLHLLNAMLSGREEVRLLLHVRHLRRPGDAPDSRGPAAGAHQPLRPDQARYRERPQGLAPPTA